ncbi:MAG: M1 family aminopeptidase [Acidobacteriota bacterium]
MRASRLVAAMLCLLALSGGGVPLTAQTPSTDGVEVLLRRLEQIVRSGNAAEYLAVLTDSADRRDAENFAQSEVVPGATRVAVKERDREPLRGTLPGNGYRLSVDVFVEFGQRARNTTWQLEVKRVGDEWEIAGQDRMAQVENLNRLSLNAGKQFDARALKISVEDLDLTLPAGSAFVIETDQGATGFVLLGRGEARFHPSPDVEKGQLKIFCGADVLLTRFDAVYVRMNPRDVEALVDANRLTPRAVDARELRRADEVFREEVPKSYAVDMADMSRELWSILPAAGDFLAEIHTPRYDTLTYTRSRAEPEDISFFDRKRHRNISVYSSAESRERFGLSYNEDDFVNYDVLGYDIDLAVSPDRAWLEGHARLQLRVLASAISSVSLRLAESLVVQSIVSDQFGRLLGVRVRNQNTIIVNLPAVLLRDDDLVLTIAYAGRLEPQREDTEALAPQGAGRPQSPVDDQIVFQPERSFLYSNRSYWYPQATVTDYATASLRLTVPQNIDCVASGTLDAGFPTAVAGKDSASPLKVYLFTTAQPLRYLAFLLSRFTSGESSNLVIAPDVNINMSVQTNPRQVRRGRELGDRANEIVRFYGSLLGDAPYPSFTLALIESELPGGHSPGFFAALNQPLPTTPYVWRNDPASFEDFPEFFIAHEMAHQYWGQAVGWRNYHEQWLSEGFAQYFAALYAQRRRGDETFTSVLRQFRRWGMQQSDQGPISLGYRLGHIRGDSRVFRALVYNKSAAVLHMLRRLVGDEAFFQGVRRFYTELRFRKAGTADFREAMEMETGRSLERFFEKWIYGSTLPRLKVGYRVEPGANGQQAIIHVEQLGEVFDVPLTVTLEYTDKKTLEVVVPVTERVVDFPVPLTGTLRGVEYGRDEGTLAEIVKG